MTGRTRVRRAVAAAARSGAPASGARKVTLPRRVSATSGTRATAREGFQRSMVLCRWSAHRAAGRIHGHGGRTRRAIGTASLSGRATVTSPTRLPGTPPAPQQRGEMRPCYPPRHRDRLAGRRTHRPSHSAHRQVIARRRSRHAARTARRTATRTERVICPASGEVAVQDDRDAREGGRGVQCDDGERSAGPALVEVYGRHPDVHPHVHGSTERGCQDAPVPPYATGSGCCWCLWITRCPLTSNPSCAVRACVTDPDSPDYRQAGAVPCSPGTVRMSCSP